MKDDKDTEELAYAVACLNDPEWLKRNGPALVKASMQHNMLLKLHAAGALNPLLKAAKDIGE